MSPHRPGSGARGVEQRGVERLRPKPLRELRIEQIPCAYLDRRNAEMRHPPGERRGLGCADVEGQNVGGAPRAAADACSVIVLVPRPAHASRTRDPACGSTASGATCAAASVTMTN